MTHAHSVPADVQLQQQKSKLAAYRSKPQQGSDAFTGVGPVIPEGGSFEDNQQTQDSQTQPVEQQIRTSQQDSYRRKPSFTQKIKNVFRKLRL